MYEETKAQNEGGHFLSASQPITLIISKAGERINVKTICGAGKRAPQAKYLRHSLEDLSSIPRAHIKVEGELQLLRAAL